MDESGKKLEKAERRIENAQRENVTILGIFAAIVIAFTAGMGFTASVLQNIDAVSIYRLVFMIVLMGPGAVQSSLCVVSFVHRVIHSAGKRRTWLANSVAGAAKKRRVVAALRPRGLVAADAHHLAG